MRLLKIAIFLAAAAACSKEPVSNVALNRTSSASSSYDHNLTAQLLTDGIVDYRGPVFLELNSSEGPVGRVERENTLNGDVMSRNILNGIGAWLEYIFHGYEVNADEAVVLYQQALKHGRGGENFTTTVPVERNAANGGLRISLTFPHEGRWRVKSVEFYNGGVKLNGLLPSEHFRSVWMSGGCEDEWVMADLGSVQKIRGVKLHWISRPAEAAVQVSKNGQRWKTIGSLAEDSIEYNCRCRYVRVLMKGAPDGERFSMTELEVFGRKKTEKTEEGGWKLCRASEVSAVGEELSAVGFDDSEWFPATVPATTLMSYVLAGAVPDPDFGDNIAQISESFFNSDFWYRKEFDFAGKTEGKKYYIDFDGINWKAEVYFNGHRLDDINGAFIRAHEDVTPLIKTGRNALAVLVKRNANPGAVKEKTSHWTGYNGGILGADNPTFHASIGWDWITTVRGRNCGIWNDVSLVEKGAAELSDPLLVSSIGGDGRASIKASVMVRNDSEEKVELEGWIGDIRFSKIVEGSGLVSFSPQEFPQLKDVSVNLWWPNGYGEPNLYDAGFIIKTGGEFSDSLHFKAGVREVKWSLENDVLKLYVNGRRFIPNGGNWGFSQQNLYYSKEQYETAVRYHRLMNMNIIRNWVGQIGDKEFYDACDKNGIMVWQDFWLANPGDGPNPDDEAMFIANAKDYVSKIRRHPCILMYCGRNEGYPPESLDKSLRTEVVEVLHPEMLYISSSADGPVSGRGPYDARTSEYYFSAQSGKFHSERGIPNVPTIEGLRRMMPEEDLWPQGEMWGKHDFTEVGAQNAVKYNKILEDAFGEIHSAEEFCYLAQWLNYEGYRAIFESSNSSGGMGMLLWMSHPAWPSLVWNTYDYFFEPTGAFFGCKKANETLHIQYNAATGQVELVNLCSGDHDRLIAKMDIYGLRGNLLSTQVKEFSSANDSAIPCFDVEKPAGEPVYYIKLSLSGPEGEVLSDNFYMLGQEPGNLRAVRSLPAAKLRKSIKFSGGAALLSLENVSDVPAVLVRVVLKNIHGKQILPVEYSDNYFSLMPGEKKKVEIRWYDSSASPAIKIEQLNMPSLSNAS